MTFDTQTLPSGMYLYQLQSSDFQSTRKLTIVK
ncbi:MAG: T9SS type A sorting domain-containing protein [Candidatus Marinimicrobia bacterium]|nr:T9SS type A sorting domain-containing protein [Candidatus Neomarinimicrobiota bacterium]